MLEERRQSSASLNQQTAIFILLESLKYILRKINLAIVLYVSDPPD